MRKLNLKDLKNLNYRKLSIAFGLIFFGSTIMKFCIFPILFRTIVNYEKALTPRGPNRKLFTNLPFPFMLYFHMFNITNPDEVMNGGKPILQEIGPFSFEWWKLKLDIVDDPKNDTLEFSPHSVFVYRPDLSKNFTGDEQITTLHPIISLGSVKIKRESPHLLGTVKKGFDIIFNQMDPFYRGSVMNYIFTNIPIDCSSREYAAKQVCRFLEYGTQGVVRLNETHLGFSFFGATNATDVGRFLVQRGKKHPDKCALMILFNGVDKLNVWKKPGECDTVFGSEGTFMRSFIPRGDDIAVFIPAVCSAQRLKYNGEAKYRNRYLVWRYKHDFLDYNEIDELKCFCDDDGVCPLKGILNLTKCVNAPVVITKPHFFESHPSLIKEVHGLEPIEKKHESYVDVERSTGIPIVVKVQNQINADIEPVEEIPSMAKMRKMVFPIMWTYESMLLSERVFSLIKYKVYICDAVLQALFNLGIVSGSLATVISTTLYIMQIKGLWIFHEDKHPSGFNDAQKETQQHPSNVMIATLTTVNNSIDTVD